MIVRNALHVFYDYSSLHNLRQTNLTESIDLTESRSLNTRYCTSHSGKHKMREERAPDRRSEMSWEWEMMRMKDREEEARRREKSRRERCVFMLLSAAIVSRNTFVYCRN